MLPFLLDQMLVCGLLGAIVAGIISILIIENRNDLLMFFMVLFGATAGWLTGMAFIFLTGGLDLSLPWMVLPAIIVAFSSILILYKLVGRKVMFTRPRWKVGRSLALVMSVVIVLSLVISLAVLAFPSYGSSINTDNSSFSGTISSSLILSSSQANIMNNQLPSSFVSIDSAKSSVRFPVISDNPEEGDYLEFSATFSVASSGGSWDQPYIKMSVIKDSNGNGQPDSGEGMWDDTFYKFATESGKKWMTNLLWQNNQPYMQNNNLQGFASMPIFHLNTITQWKDDQGRVFANTPEGYTSPYDQLSWELSTDGNQAVLKEERVAYAVIPAGSSSSIKGKIFCPLGHAGSHLVVIQAFDSRYTSYVDPDATPLSQEIMAFTVTPNGDLYCGDGICSPEIGENDPNSPNYCPGDCPAGTYTLTVNTVPTGCTVAVTGETTQNSGTSGQCIFPDLAAGSVKTVTTSKTGYVTDTQPVTMDSDKELDVTLSSGPTPPVIDINYTSWVTAAGLVGFTALGTVAVLIKGPKFLVKP